MCGTAGSLLLAAIPAAVFGPLALVHDVRWGSRGRYNPFAACAVCGISVHMVVVTNFWWPLTSMWLRAICASSVGIEIRVESDGHDQASS
eukprot:NODE_18152_length_907_cov_5.514103.p4 GENE.NODE_18152_length_907_cov_5.514103~~NODE_18152_length_907_cov_5.514103.p4  ORF type:complete len:90 (+),score=16.45 NODE_18152_length_907_cov_5.514103:399-668(+)